VTISWVIFSLLSNLCIVATEYLNRSAKGSWFSVLPYTLPFIIAAQYGLFRSFNGAPSWLVAWVVFTVGNSIARVAGVKFFAFGEVGNWWLVNLGVGVMLTGSFIIKGGLK
jgi:hypothetical protein